MGGGGKSHLMAKENCFGGDKSHLMAKNLMSKRERDETGYMKSIYNE